MQIHILHNGHDKVKKFANLWPKKFNCLVFANKVSYEIILIKKKYPKCSNFTLITSLMFMK